MVWVYSPRASALCHVKNSPGVLHVISIERMVPTKRSVRRFCSKSSIRWSLGGGRESYKLWSAQRPASDTRICFSQGISGIANVGRWSERRACGCTQIFFCNDFQRSMGSSICCTTAAEECDGGEIPVGCRGSPMEIESATKERHW